MRTTLNLSDALAEAAKRRAAEEGRTFSSLVEEGLRLVLDMPGSHRAVRLPAHGRGDGRVLVDILDQDALCDALEGSAAVSVSDGTDGVRPTACPGAPG